MYFIYTTRSEILDLGMGMDFGSSLHASLCNTFKMAKILVIQLIMNTKKLVITKQLQFVFTSVYFKLLFSLLFFMQVCFTFISRHDLL